MLNLDSRVYFKPSHNRLRNYLNWRFHQTDDIHIVELSDPKNSTIISDGRSISREDILYNEIKDGEEQQERNTLLLQRLASRPTLDLPIFVYAIAVLGNSV